MGALSELPFVSIVVPSRPGSTVLDDCLDSLRALDYPADRHEVLVTDGSRGANEARNAGVAAARGELVLFIDDDTIVPPGWARAYAAAAARHPYADCLGGAVRARFDSPPPRTCPDHELAGTVLDHGPDEHEIGEAWGGNMAVRRRAFERAGPFRAGLRVQQDWEWQRRLLAAGGRVVYVPDAWLWHRRQRSDLRVAGMVREHFLRGWTKARLGQPVPRRVVAPRAASTALHGARARCVRGLTETARDLGMLCGSFARNSSTRAASASGSPAAAATGTSTAGGSSGDACR